MNRIWYFLPRKSNKPYCWIGREQDAEINLKYNRETSYDPTVGKWTRPNPLNVDGWEPAHYSNPCSDKL